MQRRFALSVAISLFAFAAPAQAFDVVSTNGTAIKATALETFSNPWAMTFLPDGRALVTEKGGTLWLVGANGKKLGEISGVPSVRARGQGGLGDIILHPDFAANGVVYLSFVERDPSDNALSGAAVLRASLSLTESGGSLSNGEIIWRQAPKVTGNGHYGHRMAFSLDGYLFITSGERQKFTPAQNMAMNLGKIIRLTDTGAVPADNPFVGQGGITEQIWSLGHRNPLGIDFDASGQLWVHEMGPRHGDELNRIVRAENYGYPEVSEGSHYSGVPIPSHATNPAFENPAKAWVPAISPAGFEIYEGADFPDWKGDGLIGGLSSRAVIRVSFEQAKTDNTGAASGQVSTTETVAREAERYSWGVRIREIEQGPNGEVFVLEDGGSGRLVRLQPAP
jgi:glucose/arabinose dehydrogenase